ncbi:MAG: DUF4271 domain-containing protein [Flavisolibacter sp.]|nr:DUF4271 domain-containing protein [Flavisolibacter sp.]
MHKLLLILLLFTGLYTSAQSLIDSTFSDTNRRLQAPQTDTATAMLPPKPTLRFDSIVYNHHPFIRFTDPIPNPFVERKWEGKETYFYISIALLLFFALIKNGFGHYVQDVFRIFFRTTLKQRQIKEQLMAAPLPSLLSNLLFFFSGAFFLFLLLDYFRLGHQYPFWMLLAYCVAGLVAIYIAKFIMLKMFGWLLRLSGATDTYIFIVFTGNKIAGIVLLPLIVLLTFTNGVMQQAAYTLSFIIIGGLYLYRYFLSYVSVQNMVRINLFHFLMYLLAFEIIPLLLINKLLFKFLI